VTKYIARTAVVAWLAMTYGVSAAEEARDLPKIGELYGSNPSASKPYDDAFRTGLRELGYIEGRNVIVLPRYANGSNARFPELLAELLALDVDVLVVTPTAAHAAKQATKTVPIVLPSSGDPVKEGLVASLARPGGNITGLSSAAPETDQKRLELAIELLPSVKRLGVLFEAGPGIASAYEDTSDFGVLARKHGVTLQGYEIGDLEDVHKAIKKAVHDRIQVVIVVTTYLTIVHREAIINGLAAERIAVVSGGREMAEAGALLTYSPDYFDMWKRTATFVDKILKGSKPGDLPVEQPTKFELIVNQKMANRFGIALPASISVRADQVLR
jgi:putative tryptophan/tyrosine transport system substrate-binding protein